MSYSRISLLAVVLSTSAVLLVAATPASQPSTSATSIAGPDSPALGADGKKVYMKKCKKCHGADGKAQTKMGKKFEMGPIPGKMGKGKVLKVIKNGKANTKMKAFKDKLSEEEIAAVTDFVMTL